MEPTPITRPVTPIGDQRNGQSPFARRLARRRAGLADAGAHEYQADAEPIGAMALDPAMPLLEALDRLRVTNVVRPADLEYVRMLRAVKAYQDPTTAIYRQSDPLLVFRAP
jgi:hypothetical protein